MAGFSREVAKRVFAEELLKSSLAFRDGDDQYSPQYLLTPTGARCNRVFLVGTLTENDDIGGDTEYWRGRVVDPTGSIRIYAGQYDPQAARALAKIEPLAFVAVVGKPKLYVPEDGRIIINVRAETVQQVDEATRNQWILDTAKRTQERLKALENTSPASLEFSTADKASTVSPTMDAEKAIQHYHTDVEYYRQMVISALTSLRADLSQGRTEPKAETPPKPEAKVEPPAEVKDKVKPDAKKSKTKKNGSLAGLAEQDDIEEVEEVPIFNLGKKS